MTQALAKPTSKRGNFADDFMHSESEYDSQFDSKGHARSPCWCFLLSRLLYLYILGAKYYPTAGDFSCLGDLVAIMSCIPGAAFKFQNSCYVCGREGEGWICKSFFLVLGLQFHIRPMTWKSEELYCKYFHRVMKKYPK
jgi:hypothetical protein